MPKRLKRSKGRKLRVTRVPRSKVSSSSVAGPLVQQDQVSFVPRNQSTYVYNSLSIPLTQNVNSTYPVAGGTLSYTCPTLFGQLFQKYIVEKITCRLYFIPSDARYYGLGTPLIVAYDQQASSAVWTTNIQVMRNGKAKIINIDASNPMYEFVIKRPTNMINGNIPYQQTLNRDPINTTNVWTAGWLYISAPFPQIYPANTQYGFSADFQCKYFDPRSEVI